LFYGYQLDQGNSESDSSKQKNAMGFMCCSRTINTSRCCGKIELKNLNLHIVLQRLGIIYFVQGYRADNRNGFIR